MSIPQLTQPTGESILTRLLARLHGKSQFFWGVLVGVAFMSALFGIVILLLFRSLT